jgi:hypothetical protein
MCKFYVCWPIEPAAGPVQGSEPGLATPVCRKVRFGIRFPERAKLDQGGAGILGEPNSDLRSFPPSHAAIADGCVVKHEIECIRNSDGTFHFEAGAPVRQVEDHTIDQRLTTFEDDLRSLENALAHVILALLLALLRRLFHRSIFCRWHCGFFPSFQATMPEGYYPLVFQDRRFLPCGPGEPPRTVLRCISFALRCIYLIVECAFLSPVRSPGSLDQGGFRGVGP